MMIKCNRIALNQSILMNSNTIDFLKESKKHGYEKIELRISKLKEELFIYNNKLISYLKNNSMKVVALNSLDNFGFVEDDYLNVLENEVRTAGELCKILNCNLVIAPVSKWINIKPSKRVVIETTLKRLNFVSSILNDYDVVVGLEPISFPEFTVNDIKTADEIIQKSNNKKTNGLIIDLYNLFNGGMVPEDFYGLKSKIHLIHINDAEMLPLESLDILTTRTFPGDGCIDVKHWMKTAINAGYKGDFSLEIFDNKIWNYKISDAMDYIDNKLNSFFNNTFGDNL